MNYHWTFWLELGLVFAGWVAVWFSIVKLTK